MSNILLFIDPVVLQEDSPQVAVPVPQELRLDSPNDSQNLSIFSSVSSPSCEGISKKEQQFIKRFVASKVS